MKIEDTRVYGFYDALKGMRNPLESWCKSDTKINGFCGECYSHACDECVEVGENDHELAMKLIKSGKDHSKFMRMIQVWTTITAPLYWWKEFDTYKVGTTANSTSTMHKLATTPITADCFEHDGFQHPLLSEGFDSLVGWVEQLRKAYNKSKDKTIWRALIQALPESWLQTRTVNLNYEVLRNMYHARKNHKLTEWNECFIQWVESLPYSELITIGRN